MPGNEARKNAAGCVEEGLHNCFPSLVPKLPRYRTQTWEIVNAGRAWEWGYCFLDEAQKKK